MYKLLLVTHFRLKLISNSGNNHVMYCQSMIGEIVHWALYTVAEFNRRGQIKYEQTNKY